MKRIFKNLPILVLAGGLVACSDNDLDSMEGIYDNIAHYNFTTAEVLPTVKLHKGVKQLNIGLSDENGDTATLNFGAKDWILPSGTYNSTDSMSASGELSGNVQNQTITDGSVDVNILDSTYFLNGMVTMADNSQAVVNYHGPLTFIIGEDDPEASGYIMALKKEAVAQYDWSTGQYNVYPDVTKYILTFTDPDGNAAGEFDLIADNDLSASELAGTYTLQSSSVTAGLCDAGWIYPLYNMAGGSYMVDDNGVTQYLTAGTITLSTAEDADGNLLYSIAGTGLSTTTKDGTSTAENQTFSILFATYTETTGTTLTDLTIQSAKLGQEMKYSVYLPDGYTGQETLPILYLLHGYGGNNNSWLTDGNAAALTSQAISQGTVGKVVVVMPDGLNSFYVNGYQDSLQYEDYFINELIPTVENQFNVGKSKAKRAIAGLSMGGYGTLYYALEHPDMFCCSYAMSPATYVDGTPNLYELLAAADVSQLPAITIEVGTEDPLVYQAAVAFNQYAQGLNLTSYNYIERSGVHDWTFWKECYPKVLAQLGNYFN
ncbi:MAG: alpha/beta hydrolase [Prevotella sp.]